MSRALTALLAGAAVALLVAGCGGGKAPLIPRADAAQLIALLRDARAQAGATPPDCTGLAASIRKLQASAQALPSNMDSNVRDSVTNGINNLSDLSSQECTQTQTTATQTTPTVTTQTQTQTQTTPTQTQTTPTQTQTTPTTPTQTQTTPTTPGTGGAPAPGAGGATAPPGQQKKQQTGTGAGG